MLNEPTDWDKAYIAAQYETDLDEYKPLTSKQNAQFWGAFSVFMLIDLALVLLVNYGAHNGWYS